MSKENSMAEFLIAFSIVMTNEGGYANHRADRGGETYAGIARNYHPDWKGWGIIDKIKTVEVTARGINKRARKSRVLKKYIQEFYKENFWDRLRLGRVKSQVIANHLFDIAVNHGTGRVGKLIQRSYNIVSSNRQLIVDGAIGRNTLRAINSYARDHRAERALEMELKVQRGKLYESIVKRKPRQKVFIKGWLVRMEEVTIKSNRSRL